MRLFLIILLLSLVLLPAFANAHAQVPASPLTWLRSDSGIILNGNKVSAWKDRSVHRNDFAQPDEYPQPSFDSSEDSFPAIVFRGWNYMTGPAIFPVFHDYSISVIAHLDNPGAINNFVSGKTHALFETSDGRPEAVHGDFSHIAHGTIAMWPKGFSIITACYSEATQQVKFYVNGEFADSSFISSNNDSSLILGSFVGGYFLQGKLREVLLYDRELSFNELDALHNYALTRYGIKHGIPLPPPDSTFTSLPKSLQLFARNADDSATVTIAGKLEGTPADSLFALQFKNGKLIRRMSVGSSSGSTLSFDFQFQIHAEASEYRFEVHSLRAGIDSLLVERDSIACGDVILIDGQSNAIFGYDNPTYSNEFCRTFGLNVSQDLRDTSWYLSDANKWGFGHSVCGYGQRIQRDLLDRYGIPTCCINGGVSGTNIQMHERDSLYPYRLRTIYGAMHYRVWRAGLSTVPQILIWDQGELNYSTGYYESFKQLYKSWHQDYPNLRKIYLIQNRPNYCGWGNIDLRNTQRWMEDSMKDVETIASAALHHQDGCHFLDQGLDEKGDRLFKSIARDFYHAADTQALRSSNAIGAYYSNRDHSQITIRFAPLHAQFASTPDTLVANISQQLKRYLYFDDTATHVTTIEYKEDSLILDLNRRSSARNVSYLYDQYYKDTNIVYEGPWLVNERGIGALLFYQLPISDALSISRSAILDVSNNISFYPNPAKDRLHVRVSPTLLPITYTITSSTGAFQNSGSANVSPFEIESIGLSSGEYFCTVHSRQSNAMFRFTIER